MIKKYYSYFYKKVLKREPFFSKRDEKIISSFEKLMKREYGDSASEEWLYDFTLFQFQKFTLANTKMNIQVNWIYGRKALSHWRNRSLEHYEYFCRQFEERYNLKRADLIKYPNMQISERYRSQERNRFKDKVRQLIHCTELQLFDINSADCKLCPMKKFCNNEEK